MTWRLGLAPMVARAGARCIAPTIDEIVSRRNARHGKRIDAERPFLQPLPAARTSDYEDTLVYVTSAGGFTLRKVFYTVPSRVIDHRLRVRLYDDRLELFLGGTALMMRCRAAAPVPAASTVTSSTTATSSTRCAASRWRCSTWSTATSSSRARPIG